MYRKDTCSLRKILSDVRGDIWQRDWSKSEVERMDKMLESIKRLLVWTVDKLNKSSLYTLNCHLFDYILEDLEKLGPIFLQTADDMSILMCIWRKCIEKTQKYRHYKFDRENLREGDSGR